MTTGGYLVLTVGAKSDKDRASLLPQVKVGLMNWAEPVDEPNGPIRIDTNGWRICLQVWKVKEPRVAGAAPAC